MATYHVYADANIFLDFFRFSDDDLGELEKLANHIADENIVLYLPQLTAEEYHRNRDKVVLSQLAELRRPPLNFGIPLFLRDMAKAREFKEKLGEALALRNELLKEVEELAANRTFRADELISSIFSKARSVSTSQLLIDKARERLSLGNPPGKPSSIGDRLNWETLLQEVPNGSDLYLITRDNDYISLFSQAVPDMFLNNEWIARKAGKIHLFRGIKGFAKLVDDTIDFAIGDPFLIAEDPERTEAINDLLCSGSFSWTHGAVARLQPHIDSFSRSEIDTLLGAALHNNQVGGIIGDYDVEDFYAKVRARVHGQSTGVVKEFDEHFGQLEEAPF